MISKNSFRFINAAIKEAHKSNILQKHGCVIVISGKIISRGFNNHRNQSNDGFLNNTCTCHAEISAIRNFYKFKKYYNYKYKKYYNYKFINKNIKNGTLYVVRINNNGELRSSAPCINCYNTILKVGIKKIVYSDVHGNIISCYTKNYNIIHESYGYRYMIKYNIC